MRGKKEEGREGERDRKKIVGDSHPDGGQGGSMGADGDGVCVCVQEVRKAWEVGSSAQGFARTCFPSRLCPLWTEQIPPIGPSLDPG